MKGIILIINVGFIFIGFIFIITTLIHVNSSVTTTGIVKSWQGEGSKDINKPNYYPVIQFLVKNGELITFKSIYGGGPNPIYSVGSSVSILYNPDHPSDAQINEPYNIWFPSILYCIVAVFLVVFISVARRVRFNN